MKKSDLKDGMVVELRNGERYILLSNHFRNCSGCFDACMINEDLTHNSEYRKFDIVKVYTHGFNNYTINDMFRDLQLIWERKEKLKLTDDEKVILRNLDGCFKYMARDYNKNLYIYDCAPKKSDKFWWFVEGGSHWSPYTHLFQMVQWEDEKPTLIEDLLRDNEND